MFPKCFSSYLPQFSYASSSLVLDATTFCCILRIETHFCRVVYLLTGYWYFWSILLLSLFGILVVYISLLLVSNLPHFSHSLSEQPHEVLLSPVWCTVVLGALRIQGHSCLSSVEVYINCLKFRNKGLMEKNGLVLLEDASYHFDLLKG